jgi:hypothetical protein
MKSKHATINVDALQKLFQKFNIPYENKTSQLRKLINKKIEDYSSKS